jgi:riboflavin kinase/FMN adenylyltransferase
MRLIRGLHNLRPEHRGGVATIGNFDGVHRGHQAVIAQLTREAEKFGCIKTVITFEPLPQEFFQGEAAPARLTTLRERLAAFADLGVEQLLCLPFDNRLASMAPDEFIDRILIKGLAIRSLVVGDDFRFGRKREGDFTLLQQAGKTANFTVYDTNTCSEGGDRISSSRVRQMLAEGDLTGAEQLLGRPFSMSGTVIHGDKRGREIGFPTANIQVKRRRSPLRGIFVVEVHGVGGQPHPGVCSIGTRPTVNYRGFLMEIHLLDFAGDLYGRHLKVTCLKKLRDEEKFASVEAMTRQIERDTQQARDYFRW